MQDCDRASRQQTCIWFIPLPPKGNNARETEYRRHRRCPESAKINIIPSVLCHSSRQGLYSASTTSIFKGQKPARTSCPLRVNTIRIMLTVLRQSSARIFPSNSRATPRQAMSPPQGPPASRPVGGLSTLRNLRGNGIKIRGALHPRSAMPPATSALWLVGE